LLHSFFIIGTVIETRNGYKALGNPQYGEK
jgi:hypothetical protein